MFRPVISSLLVLFFTHGAPLDAAQAYPAVMSSPPNNMEDERTVGGDISADRTSPRHITISVPGVNVTAVYRDMSAGEGTILHYPLEGPLSPWDPFTPGPGRTFRQPISFSAFGEENGDRVLELARATRDFFVAGSMLIFSGLFFAPSGATKWDNGAVIREPLDCYGRNVTHTPVMDIDPWPMNYIVHPYVGSMYYLAARNTGYGIPESLFYSMAMSTVFWEYGVEAVPERPSIQDLWATPLVGSLFGETFRIMEKMIKKNDGKVLNSRPLGTLCRTLLNPARSIGNAMNGFFNSGTFTGLQGNMIYLVRPSSIFTGPLEYFLGVELFTTMEGGMAGR